jgi:hypothetical protein
VNMRKSLSSLSPFLVSVLSVCGGMAIAHEFAMKQTGSVALSRWRDATSNENLCLPIRPAAFCSRLAMPSGSLPHRMLAAKGRSGASLPVVQPGGGSNLSTVAQRLVESSDIQGRGVTHEQLAGKIDAQAAVLQAPLHDATVKEDTSPLSRASQLVATPAAPALLIGPAGTAVAATDSRQPAFQTSTGAHLSCCAPCRPAPVSIITYPTSSTKRQG